MIACRSTFGMPFAATRCPFIWAPPQHLRPPRLAAAGFFLRASRQTATVGSASRGGSKAGANGSGRFPARTDVGLMPVEVHTVGDTGDPGKRHVGRRRRPRWLAVAAFSDDRRWLISKAGPVSSRLSGGVRLAGAICLASVPAHAPQEWADPYRLTDAEKAACTGDAMRRCADAVPDESKLLACMTANTSSLRASCLPVFDAGVKRRRGGEAKTRG